eukprot:gene976-360_t
MLPVNPIQFTRSVSSPERHGRKGSTGPRRHSMAHHFPYHNITETHHHGDRIELVPVRVSRHARKRCAKKLELVHDSLDCLHEDWYDDLLDEEELEWITEYRKYHDSFHEHINTNNAKITISQFSNVGHDKKMDKLSSVLEQDIEEDDSAAALDLEEDDSAAALDPVHVGPCLPSVINSADIYCWQFLPGCQCVKDPRADCEKDRVQPNTVRRLSKVRWELNVLKPFMTEVEPQTKASNVFSGCRKIIGGRNSPYVGRSPGDPELKQILNSILMDKHFAEADTNRRCSSSLIVCTDGSIVTSNEEREKKTTTTPFVQDLKPIELTFEEDEECPSTPRCKWGATPRFQTSPSCQRDFPDLSPLTMKSSPKKGSPGAEKVLKKKMSFCLPPPPPKWSGDCTWHDILPEIQDKILSYAKTEYLPPMRATCKELLSQVERTRSFEKDILSVRAQRRWVKLVPVSHTEFNEDACVEGLKFGFDTNVPIHFPDWRVSHWAAVRSADKLLTAVLSENPDLAFRLDMRSVNTALEDRENPRRKQSALKCCFDCEEFVNARTSLSRTPLMLAAMKGSSLDVLRTLINHGADTTLMCSTGRSALVYANERGYTEIVEYFSSLDNVTDTNEEAEGGQEEQEGTKDDEEEA